ncbi:hypothetical protein [Streptomyces fulvoviolaceus]|uniref:hypothetical protein n=1 Tax=Streptomyces fulvoviolaceus TaxID=285535 RepID=UPI00131ABFF0|nr:hypothetical protein [Streptomyces fulvoviolaceus]MCT9078901.1 hypothetical protein [Streptomyces fulvoviolaceus]
MPIPWRSGAEVFAQALRERGIEPDAVRDVGAAWDAFGEFCQVEVDGIERTEDDGDGFIAEWGRWDWNDDQPSLSFGRLLAVTGTGGRDDPEWQPEYWKVELELIFPEDPAWADLDGLGHQDTGYDFDEIGAPRADALVEVRRFIESYPQLAAMWRAEPTRSELTFERAG